MNPSHEQLEALRAFAKKHGRYWKRKLGLLWATGADVAESGGPYLRQLRNIYGPEWLAKFKLEK